MTTPVAEFRTLRANMQPGQFPVSVAGKYVVNMHQELQVGSVELRRIDANTGAETVVTQLDGPDALKQLDLIPGNYRFACDGVADGIYLALTPVS